MTSATTEAKITPGQAVELLRESLNNLKTIIEIVAAKEDGTRYDLLATRRNTYVLYLNSLRLADIALASTASLATQDAPHTAAPAIPEGWQPIETAPKDGTMVLVAAKWRHTNEVTAGFYKADGGEYPWVVFDARDEADPFNGWREGVFSHWMSLPASPAAHE